MLLGGWAGDRLARRYASGRLLFTSLALLASVPATYYALEQPPGQVLPFLTLLGLAWMMMYSYYPNIYATLQDILEPTLRGTGTALYFLAMYGLGAFWGPVAAGWASDTLAIRSAVRAGVLVGPGSAPPEQFRALGLHRALYGVPLLGILLAAVLAAAARTVQVDIERLRSWQRVLK